MTGRAEQTAQSERMRMNLPTRCTVEQVRAARLAVARAALDVDDCAEMLDALGIGREVQV